MRPEARPPREVPLRSSGDWRRPRHEQQGLQSYLQTVRERLGLILVVLTVTVGAAVLYLATAPKVYQAEADMLVTPLASDQANVIGLPLIRESSDPTRDVETASRLVTTRDVARRVARSLRLSGSAADVLASVEAAPVAQSNIVAITAKRGSAKEARDVANGFGESVIADRTRTLHEQLDKSIERLRTRQREGTAPQTGVNPQDSVAAQLSVLETLRGQDDPTLRLETRADAPTAPSSPKPFLTIAAGILAGLVLGVGGAFALNALDPRLRREEQLRKLFSLPVLARIPEEKRARTTTLGRRRLGIGPRRKRRRALAPGELSPTTIEAYRTLRAMLAASRVDRGQGRSVLVTGPSPSEGKTTTAINLASSLALAGNRVILIEADFRRPTVGEAFNVRPAIGIGKVMLRNATLDEALVPAKPFGQNLRLLLVDRADDWLAELLSLPAANSLLDEAEELADYVVIDSPPLTEVIDALPLAQQVDDVLIVVRLGNSRLPQLSRLGDLLEQNNIHPTGFAVVGVGSSEEQTYYLSNKRQRVDDAEAREPDAEFAP